MATTHIALLRGINVGKAKRISMAELKATVEGLGYTGVRTLLNSGNVVFTASKRAAHAARIEKAIADELGVVSRVVTLSAEDLDRAIAENPFEPATKEPSRFLVVAVGDAAHLATLQPLVDAAASPEAFAIGSRVGYLWCANGILESPLATALMGRLYKDLVTSRNWSTMLKLQAMTRSAA